jgi:ATP-binding cassette subfamily B protein
VRRILAPIRGRLIGAVAMQAVATAAQVAGLGCLALLAARVVRTDRWAHTDWGWVIAALVLLVAGTVVAGLATTVSHLADAALLRELRRRMADRLSRVRLGWFTSHDTAMVKKAVQDDTASMHHLVAHALLDITTVLIAPLAAVILIATTQWILALVMLALAVVAYLLFQRAMAGSGARMAEYGAAVGELDAATVEAVEGVDVVRAFARRDTRPSRLRRAATAFHDFFLDWVGETRFVTAVAFVLASPVTAVLLMVCCGLVLIGLDLCTPADVIPALVLGPFVSAPVNTIGTRVQSLQQGMAAAQAIEGICRLEVLPTSDSPRTPQLDGVGPVLEARGVSFGYQPDEPVLHDVSFRLMPGTLTAVVGESGAGKSTLASLLARFDDPDRGAVLLGGVDLRDIDPQTLYASIGFVFQDVVLVRETVREVIRMGRVGACDADVEKAARAANIHDRIMQLPHGYDSEVGRDVEFSGGEAQRVAIARALLADAPVIVLDEATAYADPESEDRVQRALSRLVENRTVVVIAHRLASVRNADQILVLDRGRLVQQGTHDQLVAREGPYRRLWSESMVSAVTTATPEDVR